VTASSDPAPLVLGIDPGLARTGWALIGTRLVASGLIETPARTPLGDRLKRLHGAVLALLDLHRPEAVALEQLFFLRSTRAIAATSQARGVILLASALRGLEAAEYNPRDVKMALTGNGAALKPQMQRMVRLLLGLREDLRPDDVADAAAIALCHQRTRRFLARVAPPAGSRA